VDKKGKKSDVIPLVAEAVLAQQYVGCKDVAELKDTHQRKVTRGDLQKFKMS
jgi:hypothetical protein